MKKKILLVILCLHMIMYYSCCFAATSTEKTSSSSYVSNTLTVSNYAINFGQKLNAEVYTGPGYWYLRAANGKAQFISQEFRFIGLDGDWLFVRCKVKGGLRYGYIDVSNYSNITRNVPQLNFSYKEGIITRNTSLWDSMQDHDIGPLVHLGAGSSVTYLGNFFEEYYRFAYIETEVYGQPVRGFVDLNCIQIMDE